MGSKIIKEIERRESRVMQESFITAKFNNSKRKISYFSTFMGHYRFFLVDLLTSDLTVVAKNFGETIPSFLWLKDDNSLVIASRKNSQNRWELAIYCYRNNLLVKICELKGKNIRLWDLSPSGREVCLLIENKKRKSLYTLNLETHKLNRIINGMNKQIETCHWVSKNKIYLTISGKHGKKEIWEYVITDEKFHRFFEQSSSLQEEIVGITNDKKMLFFNMNTTNGFKSGAINTQTNEINWLPIANQKISAISSDGKKILVFDVQELAYVLIRLKSMKKKTLAIIGEIKNPQFCVENEFLIYFENITKKESLSLFDLTTNETNQVSSIKDQIFGLKNSILVL